MSMEKDKLNCGDCGASSEGDNTTLGNCRLYPPRTTGNVIDAYPTVHMNNVGCLQHTKRSEPALLVPEPIKSKK